MRHSAPGSWSTGCGRCCERVADQVNGFDGGWVLINMGWGLGVMPLPVSKGAPTRARVAVDAGYAEEELPGGAMDSGRKTSDWSYAWVPVLGPLAGGALAGFAAQFLF